MSSARLSILLRIPPIAYFVIVFAVGLIIDALAFWPLHFQIPGSLVVFVVFSKYVLLLVAAYFGLGAFGMFLVQRMLLMPGDSTTRLVTNGPFAFSRNPMYLGLALLYAGLCLTLGLPVTLLLLLIPLLVMQLVIIPYEEKCLTETFGEAYAAYCRTARRWI